MSERVIFERTRNDRRTLVARIENQGRRVENLETADCKLIIVPTLCFSDIECFEDTVVFEDLNPAPAPVPPLEARVFPLDFKTCFIDENTIRKTVRFRIFIRYLTENGTTAERIRDRVFTQDVDINDRCVADVCADADSTFLCRITDLCVRRACVAETEEIGVAPDDIVVDIVGRLAIQIFVKQRLCVQLCPEDRCPQGIEAAALCIENTDCVACSTEEVAEAEEDCNCCRRPRIRNAGTSNSNNTNMVAGERNRRR